MLRPRLDRMESQVARVHSKESLAAYAESVVAGARVALFGDGSLGLGARLVSLGARDVLVFDPDRLRAQAFAERAPDGVVVHAFASPGLESGLIDVAIVPDLGAFEDPEALLSSVRQALTPDGLVVLAAANRDVAVERARGFDYYELFDLVAREFSSIRMVAQLPFQGVAYVALGEDDESPGVSVDTQLADGERVPAGYVVLAGQRAIPAELQAYAIVELPSDLRARGESEGVARHDDLRAQRRIELLEAQAAAQSQRLVQQAEQLTEAAERLAAQTEQLEALAEQLESQAEQIDAQTERLTAQAEQLEVSRERAGAGERAAELAVKLDSTLRAQLSRSSELEGALVESTRRLSELSTEVEQLRAAALVARSAAANLNELAVRAERSERRTSAYEQELAQIGEAHALELHRFETALQERARAAQDLQAEVARRDRMIRELVGALEDAGAGLPATPGAPGVVVSADGAPPAEAALEVDNARLRKQLDELAFDLARRQGDAQAMAWTVAELERRLEQAKRAGSSPAMTESGLAGEGDAPKPIDQQLAAALDEADALRRALAQEHDARVRAESAARDTR